MAELQRHVLNRTLPRRGLPAAYDSRSSLIGMQVLAAGMK
jgi:hypothetical protein